MQLENDGWYKISQKGNSYKVAPPIKIVKKKINMETKEHFIVIDDGYGNEHEDTMEILNSKNFESLTKYGFAITPANKSDLLNELVKQTTHCRPEYLYNSVGLITKDDHLSFQGHELIIADKSINGTLNPDSNYDLKPKGTLEKWLQMFKWHVKGTSKLELAVVLGTSGVVFRHLASQGLDLLNPIIHFSGDSSTGKTTAAQLALSVAGNPGKGKGQFKNWNNTENAFQATIYNNFGIPMLFDEISTYRGRNVSQLIYQLAEGNPRGRAGIDGNLRKQPDAATVIFSTGETNVTEHSTNSNNTGVGVRILEFDGVITQSAGQASAIKKYILNNYGHILPMVAEELLDSEADDVVEIFEDHHQYFLEALENTSSVVERVSNFYAAIVTAGDIFNQTMINAKLTEYDLVNLDKLKRLLVEHEQKTAAERDIAEEFYSALIMHLIENQHLIVDKKNDYGRVRETIGYYEYTDSITYVQGSSDEIKEFNIKLLKSVFDQVIQKNNFEGHTKIKNALIEKDYIIQKDGKRIATQETIKKDGKSSRESFYTIKILEESQAEFNTPENRNTDQGIQHLKDNLKNSQVNNNPFTKMTAEYKAQTNDPSDDLKGL